MTSENTARKKRIIDAAPLPDAPVSDLSVPDVYAPDASAPMAGVASRQQKSASAFRTISEVASELNVPAHVLRFWEGKFPQIRPLKRAGGRRYYRPEDVDLLRRIRHFLYDDRYTIKGVQKLLRGGSSEGLTGAIDHLEAAAGRAQPHRLAASSGISAAAAAEEAEIQEETEDSYGFQDREALKAFAAEERAFDHEFDREVESILDELNDIRNLLTESVSR
ncbi:MAG: MerR family transcriptional regulator [Candidatus Symbiobacter sp.]|nr:MerR family transcriptional regulator [Candidatus Symbiobacter sp.]